MTKTCNTCRYFAELAVNPVPASSGECRLYPEPSLPKLRTYWCGQWREIETEDEG
jgi:hypothetical protein